MTAMTAFLRWLFTGPWWQRALKWIAVSPVALAALLAGAFVYDALDIDVLWVLGLASLAGGTWFAVRAWREVSLHHREYKLLHPLAYTAVAFWRGAIWGPVLGFALLAAMLTLAAPAIIVLIALGSLRVW